jgi:hypothetical protein
LFFRNLRDEPLHAAVRQRRNEMHDPHNRGAASASSLLLERSFRGGVVSPQNARVTISGNPLRQRRAARNALIARMQSHLRARTTADKREGEQRHYLIDRSRNERFAEALTDQPVRGTKQTDV